LATASRNCRVITHHYTQNIDLRDAKTVLSNSGTAIMGSLFPKVKIELRGDHFGFRLLMIINKITGAKTVLLLIVSGSNEITLDEIGKLTTIFKMKRA
jgi:cell division protein FtsZ